jgi:hypothetical protein
MASCGRLEIDLLLNSQKLRQADFQSAAGYQPALHRRETVRRHKFGGGLLAGGCFLAVIEGSRSGLGGRLGSLSRSFYW